MTCRPALALILLLAIMASVSAQSALLTRAELYGRLFENVMGSSTCASGDIPMKRSR